MGIGRCGSRLKIEDAIMGGLLSAGHRLTIGERNIFEFLQDSDGGRARKPEPHENFGRRTVAIDFPDKRLRLRKHCVQISRKGWLQRLGGFNRIHGLLGWAD